MTVKLDEETKATERAAGANPDPITGEPGSHPLGTATGSTGGAAAGALAGAVLGGPVGAVVGGVAGAVLGGGAGHAAGEAVNPTADRDYWKSVYETRPYYREGRDVAFYEGAYRYGRESASKPELGSRSFDEAEPELSSRWTGGPWADFREAVKDSFERARANRKNP